ncbi:hypothetical protein GOD67_29400 [Sinorhizobium medicae]|nr:hypothetical protein [Sinorhizobium medicae]MDX0846290.1 hypothetical protein [Sinorhizobium medicae]
MLHWGVPSATFDGLSSFCESEVPEGISQITFGRCQLNLLLRSRPSRNLIVFFSPAAQRAPGRTPPFFAGVDITKEIDASFLAIDDPALQYAEDVALGWHAGAADFPLQQVLPFVIRQVIEQSLADRVIISGASSGGFASLYYGTLLPKAIVLAVNPQTDILRYGREHFERYARVCFGWDGEQPIEGVFGSTVTCLPKLYHKGARSRAIYLQNSDDWHIKPHALPLIRALGGKDEPIDQSASGMDFIFRKWGEGHAPLPRLVYKAALHHLAERGPDGFSEAVDEALSSPQIVADSAS